MSKTVARIARYRWLIPISLTLLTIFSIVSLPLPNPRDPTAEVVIGNEPFWFKPSVLEGVFIRDVFRTKDDQLVIFFLKDYRKSINVDVKVDDKYYPLTYDCYYPQCQGTFDECTYQDFYGTLKINSTDLVDDTVTIKTSELTLEHSFKILDVRGNGTYQHQLGVVLQPAYYLADWQNLIQYFESWLAHGATKFYIYHYSWTRQVDAIIKFYKNKLGDGLEILPWSALPVREVDKGRFSVDANTRMFNLVSEAAMNNALYRAKGTVKFIAMMDLDELMYVGGGNQLISLLTELEKESPQAAQFSFEWIHSGVQISLSGLERPSDVNFDYLHTVKPVTNDSLETIYFTSRKVIHMTSRVEILDTHNTLKNHFLNETHKFETVNVDSGRASCLHIRRIFDAVKLREDRKNMLAKYIYEINENYSRRINGTAFSDLHMSSNTSSNLLQCPEYDLNQHDGLLFLLDILGWTNLLINPYTIYCIIFRSTKYMRRYRWFMLYHQIVAFASDLTVSLLIKPTLFIPVAAGTPQGFLKGIIPTRYLAAILIGGLCFAISTVSPLFAFRYAAAQGKTSIPFHLNVYLVFSGLIATTPGFGTLLADREKVETLAQKYNCITPALIAVPNVMICDRYLFLYLVFGPISLTFVIYVAKVNFFIFATRKVIQTDAIASANLKRMQRNLLIQLSIQAILPFSIVMVPAVGILVVIAFEMYGYTYVGTLAEASWSVFSLISAVVVIVMNPTYHPWYMYAVEKWRGRKGAQSAIVVSVHYTGSHNE